MRAGGEDRKAMLGRHGRDGLAQVAQFRARVRHVAMRRGDDLDLRLQEFGGNPAVGRRLGGLEQRLRDFGGDALGLRVDQEILLLDAEGEVVGHAVLIRCGRTKVAAGSLP